MGQGAVSVAVVMFVGECVELRLELAGVGAFGLSH